MSRDHKASELETAIREMTRPINGQYPRPWMTNLTNPADAQVFTVGMNQSKSFRVEDVGSHEHYLDALFNRGPETCRGLYDRLTIKPSPTRRNTDGLIRMLAKHGVTGVLETNVVCYSTPMSADLRQAVHAGGAERGRELFCGLLDLIRPRVLIAHGTGTARELGRVLKRQLPQPPREPGDPISIQCGEITVVLIPSLAPPGFNMWSRWAQDHLEAVSRAVASQLAKSEP